MKYIDFTHGILERKYVAIFRQPDLNSDIFLVQFNRHVWNLVVLTVLGLVAVMTVMNFLSRKVHGKKDISESEFDSSADIASWAFCKYTKTTAHNNSLRLKTLSCSIICDVILYLSFRKSNLKKRIFDLLTFILTGFISQQGYDQTPRNMSLKILYLNGFVFGMLCFVGFSANIITTLSTSKEFETLDQLLAYPSMRVIMGAFVGFQEPFRENSMQLAQGIVDRHDKDKESVPCFEELENDSNKSFKDCDGETLDKIAYKNDKSTIFIGPDTFIFGGNFRLSKERNTSCSLKHFSLPIGKSQMHYGIRKNLPEKKLIDKATIRLMETGIMKKLNSKFKPQPPDCDDSNANGGFTPVSCNSVLNAYVLLIGGYVVAIAIFICEKFICPEYFMNKKC